MDNLDRLAGSIAQIELLVASLKREGRDLAARLAQAAAERRQLELAHEAQVRGLKAELEQAQAVLRHDPGLEARAQAAELEAADLARQLEAARREHYEEKGRFEARLRELDAELLAAREAEQAPVVPPEALRQAEEELARLRGEKAAWLERQAALERRVTALESEGLELARRLEEARAQAQAAPPPAELEALRTRLAQLEAAAGEAGRLAEQAQKLEEEKAALRRQRRELAAFAKERAALRRRAEELVATLESVRLG